jgi:hypothetical protein
LLARVEIGIIFIGCAQAEAPRRSQARKEINPAITKKPKEVINKCSKEKRTTSIQFNILKTDAIEARCNK